MIALKPISFEHLEQLVNLGFKDDVRLLKHYHISPGTLSHCVDDTFSAISENYRHYKESMKFYEVALSDKPIGFTVIIKNAQVPHELYSFGINIGARTKEVVVSWLSTVKEIIDDDFYVVLWNKNTRAINFFKKNGLIVKPYLNNEEKTLIICQQED